MSFTQLDHFAFEASSRSNSWMFDWSDEISEVADLPGPSLLSLERPPRPFSSPSVPDAVRADWNIGGDLRSDPSLYSFYRRPLTPAHRKAPQPPRRWTPRNSKRKNHIAMVEPERLGLWTVTEAEEKEEVDEGTVRSSAHPFLATMEQEQGIAEDIEAFFDRLAYAKISSFTVRRADRSPPPPLILTPDETYTRRRTDVAMPLSSETAERFQRQSRYLHPIQSSPSSALDLTLVQRSVGNTGTGMSSSSIRGDRSMEGSPVRSVLLPSLPIISTEEFYESRASRDSRSNSTSSSGSRCTQLMTPLSPSPVRPSLHGSDVVQLFENLLNECDEDPIEIPSKCLAAKRPLKHERQEGTSTMMPSTPHCSFKQPQTPMTPPPKRRRSLEAELTPMEFDGESPSVASRKAFTSLQPPKSSRALQAMLSASENIPTVSSHSRPLPSRPALPMFWTNRI